MATQVLIGLGSNLGERETHLTRAWEMLGETLDVVPLRISRFYETEPVLLSPDEVQPMYLNAVGLLKTKLHATELLRAMQVIEEKLGRVRTRQWEARAIDLDLLLFGDLVMQSKELTVPHLRMTERLFVLEPAAEIVPDMLHPITKKTISQLLSERR